MEQLAKEWVQDNEKEVEQFVMNSSWLEKVSFQQPNVKPN